jgi:FAD/FMN-containing dehydrogenase
VADRLAEQLAAVVGEGRVLLDPELKAPYERDWTGRFSGRARLVVSPGTTEEVAAVLRACAADGVPVVPQGGRTGMVGGGVPRDDAVVLSLVRLDVLEPVDPSSAQVTAGAGATLGAVQRHAIAAGLELPLDHGARDSATIGGAVATNAGGTRTLRHGTTRANVTGLEAVLADGTVLRRLGGLPRDNAGYDLPGLIVGSEGTLAVVTRVRLRLVAPPGRRTTVLCGVESTAAAVGLLAALRGSLGSLESCELFYRDGLELVRRHTGTARPLPGNHPVYVLVECAAGYDPLQELAEAIAAAGIVETAVATTAGERDTLWAYRERHTEAIQAEGIPHKLDVSLPIAALPAFERDVRARVAGAAPGARVILFGHLGDGNLHVNVLDAEPGDERVDDAVLQLVAELGGSIGAEHGIGFAKRQWLHLTRSAGEIDAMRAVKRALDPAGILNPGVLLPAARGGRYRPDGS